MKPCGHALCALSLGLLLALPGAAMAGASSTPANNVDAGGRIQKINRHAVKSAALVRQLLAQNGVAVKQQ